MTKACRTKYLGESVKLRGRAAKVVGCARPKAMPAPKKPVARFRVRYGASGNVRPVPKRAIYRAIYRAARCARDPGVKGCAPLDIEKAPWLSRRAVDTSFDFGEQPTAPAPRTHAPTPPRRPVDPCAEDLREVGEGWEAWQLARRIPCAAPTAKAPLTAALRREREALCESDGDPAACRALDRLTANCVPSCAPGTDLGQCRHQVTDAQLRDWQSGAEMLPSFFFDTDAPHKVGAGACYFGPAMTARRRLHNRVRRQTVIPQAVLARGDAAVDAYMERAIRTAESAWTDHAQTVLWRHNDARLRRKATAFTVAHHKFGEDDLDDLAVAFLAAENSDMTGAYILASRFNVTDADGDVNTDGIADALWETWAEGQSVQRGGKARIVAMRKRYRGVYEAARAIARTRLKRAMTGG